MLPEHKRNISKARKGMKFSEQHKRNLARALKGRIFSEESKKKMSDSHIGKPKPWIRGSNHYLWKDKPAYVTLHIWVRKYLPMPELCQECNKVPPEDLANITGIYNRDFKNWKYMCAKCHGHYDFAGKKHSEEHRKKMSIGIKKWWRKKKLVAV